MARSLISGLINAGFPGSNIHATDIDALKAQSWAKNLVSLAAMTTSRR
jgi:pyrroline-5-carboxylate reductase